MLSITTNQGRLAQWENTRFINFLCLQTVVQISPYADVFFKREIFRIKYKAWGKGFEIVGVITQPRVGIRKKLSPSNNRWCEKERTYKIGPMGTWL